jgi:hypothetical protein
MQAVPQLTEGELDALRQIDTWMVANAIESFNVRLHNTGFADARIRCMFEDAPPQSEDFCVAKLREIRKTLP